MISVIIPTYNRYNLVLNAIDSVINQTYKNFEIIVVDDCSTDKNYESLKHNNKIKYLKTDKRIGIPSGARNLGIKNSKYEWIAFLDDDDYWLPNKLETQIKFLDKYDFICSEALSENKMWAKGIHRSVWDKINPKNILEFDFNLINRHNLIINSTVIVNKNLIKKIGYLDESILLRGCEDYHAWKEILKLGGKCFFIETPLIEYETKTYKFWKEKF